MLNLESFRQFLINKGYKEYSANGNPSSALDYSYRLGRLLAAENTTLDVLSNNIQKYIDLYGRGGEKWCVGRRSHESYINALKQFRKFVLVQRFGGANA